MYLSYKGKKQGYNINKGEKLEENIIENINKNIDKFSDHVINYENVVRQTCKQK